MIKRLICRLGWHHWAQEELGCNLIRFQCRFCGKTTYMDAWSHTP